MLWTAALLLWYCLRTAWRTIAFAVRVATFVLSLPFRAVGLAYKIFLVASLCCLKLLDCYWRVLVLERSMLFSWIMYELVLSISLLIGLKAAHALVWFSKRALRACCLSQESQVGLRGRHTGRPAGSHPTIQAGTRAGLQAVSNHTGKHTGSPTRDAHVNTRA